MLYEDSITIPICIFYQTKERMGCIGERARVAETLTGYTRSSGKWFTEDIEQGSATLDVE